MNGSIYWRVATMLMTAMFVPANVHAQVPSPAASLNKQAFFVQTGPNTVTGDPQADGLSSFRFIAFVLGVPGITNSTVTNSFTMPNNGVTRALSNNNGWSYTQYFTSEAELAATFPAGIYQMTFAGRPPVSIPFGDDQFPDAPVPTLSAGSFNRNGEYVVDRSVPLTITIRFGPNLLAGFSRLFIRLDNSYRGDGSERYFEVDNSGSDFTDSPLSLTVPAGFFKSGESYGLTLIATRIVSRIPVTVLNGSRDEARSVHGTVLRLNVVVGDPPRPEFTAQPQAQSVAAGATAVFAAVSPNATSYQWRKDGANIADATSATLVIQNVSAAQAGAYSVVASNNVGNTTSATAALAVAASTADPGRLINLSILTPLAGGETMTLGTVLGGAGTSGAKPLLVRAVGPSLAPLGVTGYLPDPTLTLVSGSRTVATNNDWGGTAALSNAFASVGAFGFTSAASKDAAIFQPSLAPGGYTVLLGDAGTGSGTVIAELYDASGAAYTAGTPRLVNVSVLKQIAAGGSLTAGFVVGGTTATTVLIRAVGPTLGLAPFGLDGVMPDPQLKLFDQRQALVAANDNWGGDASIAAVASRVGAFGLSGLASKDAVLLLTLAPGSYTAEASPVAGTAGGTAIVEIYEVR